MTLDEALRSYYAELPEDPDAEKRLRADLRAPDTDVATDTHRRRWITRLAPVSAAVAVAAVAVSLVLLTTSGHSDNVKPGTTPPPNSSVGTVVGQLRIVGGPAPGVNRPMPGTVWAYEGHAALAQLVRMQAAAHVNTDAAGHFTLTLKPGEYTLVGAQGFSHSVKAAGCGGPVRIHVQASTRTSVKLVCSVP